MSEGAKKRRKAGIKKFGSLANYKAHMQEIGAKGGKALVPKGFSITRKTRV